jgi:hypothetical protein
LLARLAMHSDEEPLSGGVRGGFAQYSFDALQKRFAAWNNECIAAEKKKKAKLQLVRKQRAAKKQAQLEREEAMRYDIRNPKHTVLNGKPLVRLTKRLRDPPPMVLEDVESNEQLQGWVQWAQGVWDDIEIERMGGGRGARVRSPAKRRKTNTTADRKLADWDKKLPPLCVRDFAGLEERVLMRVLLAWDFFVRFKWCLAYDLEKHVTLDAFLAALNCPKPTAIVDAYCSSLLKLVLTPKKTKKGNPGVVVNTLTWQSYLCVFLAEKINVEDTMAEFRDVMDLLHEETFYLLQPERRIAVVLMLCHEALASPAVREFTDTGFNRLEKARKAADNIKIDARSSLKKMMLTTFDVSATVASMLDEVCAENPDTDHPDRDSKRFQNKAEKAAAQTDMHALNSRLKKLLKRSSDQSIVDAQTHYRDCKEEYPVRTEPLGLDRYYNRYWMLENAQRSPARIFVEYDPESYQQYFASAYGQGAGSAGALQLETEEGKPICGFYQTQQQISALIGFLNDKGTHESQLRRNLQTRFGTFSECKWHEQSAAFGDSPQEPLLWNAYEAVLESVRPSLRSGFTSKGMFRCPTCQECVDIEVRGHCDVCHDSQPIHTNRKLSLFNEHQKTCTDVFTEQSNSEEEKQKQRFILSLASQDRAELAAMNAFEDNESPSAADGPAAPAPSSSSSSASSDSQQGGAMDVDAPSSTMDLSEDQMALVTARRWWMKEPSPVFMGSSFFNATGLAQTDLSFRALKAVLFDVEAAIPVEAQSTYMYDSARERWLKSLKSNYSLPALVGRVQEILMTLEPKWLRVWFEQEAFSANLQATRTLPELARHIFFLDQALCYDEDEKRAADKAYSALNEGEDASESDASEAEAFTGGCRVCHKDRDEKLTLVCDECEDEYHTYCCRPRLKEVPEGDWFCARCTAKANARARRNKKEAERRAKKKVEAENCAVCGHSEIDRGNDIIFCDGCNRGYHQHCVDPPVTEVPPGDWFCSACGSEDEDSSDEHSNFSESSESSDDASSSSSSDSGSSSSDSGSSGEEGDEPCAVCASDVSTKKNPIVTCTGPCEINCHKQCVGVSARKTEWKCDRCKSGDSNKQCALCPRRAGAVTVIAKSGSEFNGQFAHIICALCIPEVSFGDFTKRTPIIKVDKISPAEFAEHKCNICHIDTGVCISCSDRRCSLRFHASCAVMAESIGRYKVVPTSRNRSFQAYCPTHSRGK